MSATDDLGQRLREHYPAVVDTDVPAGFVNTVYATAVAQTRRTVPLAGWLSRGGTSRVSGNARPRTVLQPSLLPLLGLTLALLVGALVVGSLLLRPSPLPNALLRLTETGPMQEPRAEATAVRLGDGRVLVIGGVTTDGASGTRQGLASAEVFDPASGTWADAGTMSEPRVDAAAAVLPDGRVLVTGGSAEPRNGPSRPSSSATSEIWDPITGTFSSTGSMLQGRSGHTASTLSDGRVLVTGGSGDVPPGGDTTQLEAGGSTAGATLTGGSLRSAEVWLPATGTFGATGSMFDTRSDHIAVPLPDDDVIVAGGLWEGGAGGGLTSSVELWSKPNNGFSRLASYPLESRIDGGALLPDGRIALCCVTRDEREQLIVFPVGDFDALEVPIPTGWDANDLAALPDDRILLPWSGDGGTWGIASLDLDTGAIGTLTSGAGASPEQGSSASAPDRPGGDRGGIMVELADGRVLLAGGYLDTVQNDQGVEVATDHAYVVASDARP